MDRQELARKLQTLPCVYWSRREGKCRFFDIIAPPLLLLLFLPTSSLAVEKDKKEVLSQGLVISSDYGYRKDPINGKMRFHSGIDLRAKRKEPVRALHSGRVFFSSSYGGYGNLVGIKHGSNLTSHYAHLEEVMVRVGERVERGAPIGSIGSSGRSTAPHLHFEVRYKGISINPKLFLKEHSPIPR